MRAIPFLLPAAVLLAAACAPAAPPSAAPVPAVDPRVAAVDSLMARFDGEDTPGAAVLVFRGDETLLSKGYGQANLEYGIPVTPRTVFHVASVSKQFTAYAVAMLAAEGRLSLDDDVRQHLPELPDFGERITLRHLVHHTSGMRDQWTLWMMAGGALDDVIRQDDLLRLITRQRELNFAPGAQHLYSNTGYTLLAEVVERVTGEPFDAWMEASVFAPLGMEHTQVYDDHRMLVPHRAYSYQAVDGGGYEKAVLSYANYGATSLFTTTEDLARWLRNFGHARVGGPAASAMVRERGVLAGGDTLAYALGVVTGRHRGQAVLEHGGADAGYRAWVAYYPELDAGVVVLANLASFNPGRIGRRIAEIWFEDEMEPAPAGAERSAVLQPVPVAQEVLGAYAGTWRLESMILDIEHEGGRLVVLEPDGDRAILVSTSDSTFAIPAADVRITFHREGDGAPVDRATLRQGAATVPLERTRRYVPAPEVLRSYAGRYYSPELETFYEIVIQDGTLVARHRRHGDVPLRPQAPDAFVGAPWWFTDVAFDRGPEGSVTGMRVSSGRVRNLRFQKVD